MTYEDITKTGGNNLQGLRFSPDTPLLKRLQEKLGKNPEDSEMSPLETRRRQVREKGLIREAVESIPEDVGLEYAEAGYGKSIYDKVDTLNQLDNLQDIRAHAEPWYVKTINGVGKMITLAGTTFLDGTVGTVTGIFQGLSNLVDNDKNTGFWQGMWDNDFSKAMKTFNDYMEEALPNYYSQDEQNNPLSWRNVFSANSFADKFIKNLGFTIGAAYSGSVWSMPLSTLGKAIGAMSKVGNALKNGRTGQAIVNTLVGGTIAAINEGSIEALNNSEEWYKPMYEKLKSEHNDTISKIRATYGNTAQAQQLIDLENQNYQEELDKLDIDRAKMGNADLFMNIPILTLSNIVGLGKFFSGGYKPHRLVNGIIKRGEKYAADRSRAKDIFNIVRGPISEGTEELAQEAANRISADYYTTDVNNFIKAKKDPNAAQEVLDWSKSFSNGLLSTLTDDTAWEQFIIGGLTGALGMPRFRSPKSSSGKWQAPFTIEEGIIGNIKENRNIRNKQDEVVNYLNNRLEDPNFVNYYQGLVRHQKYQNDMDAALESGDEFVYKNAEHAQLISDIEMFHKAGKLNDLKLIIENGAGTTDEDIDALIRNTSSVVENEDGTKSIAGPFAKYAQLENDEIISNYSENDKEEIITTISKYKKDMMSTIDNYVKTMEELDLSTNEILSDDQLRELTFIKTQLDNWKSRAKDMGKDIQASLKSLAELYDDDAELYQSLMESSKPKEGENTNETYESEKKAYEVSKKNSTYLKNIIGLHEDAIVPYFLMTDSEDTINALKEAVEEASNEYFTEDEKQSTTQKLTDIIRATKAMKLYGDKLTEYLSDPTKQKDAHDKAAKQLEEEEKKKNGKSFKDKLLAAKTMGEFRKAVSEEEDIQIKKDVLSELESEENNFAKEYNEMENYVSDVTNSLEEDPSNSRQAKDDALKLFKSQYDNTGTLKEIADFNSVHINNEFIFEDEEGTDDDKITRFQNAKFALQEAMSKVNAKKGFKERFGGTYVKMKKEGKDTPDPAKDGSGTIDPVNPENSGNQNFGKKEEDEPIGDENFNDIRDNNVDENKGDQPKVEGEKKYYRPAIPEAHIAAAQEGSIVPFAEEALRRGEGDFHIIYNHLKDSGAFEYVNSGKLSVGDEIIFVIDNSFEEKVKDESWHTSPTIFMAVKSGDKIQLVGSLDQGNSINSFVGLSALTERINKEFREFRKNKDNEKKLFISKEKTRVSKMMAGKFDFTDTEIDLKDIPGLESTPIFGIGRYNEIDTNGKLSRDKVKAPKGAVKNGRLYLLVPNGTGTYSPIVVRVKHFNATEFNLNDATISNTAIGKEINSALDILSNASSEEEVSKAMEDLSKRIYLKGVTVTYYEGNKGTGIIIVRRKLDDSGNVVYKKNGEGKLVEERETVNIRFTTTGAKGVPIGITIPGVSLAKVTPSTKSTEDIKLEILNVLQSFNLPLQVNRKTINTDNYNTTLIESGVLTSNLREAKVKSSWFTTDYLDNTGNRQPANNPEYVGRNNAEGSVQLGINIVVNGVDIIVDLDRNEIIVNGETRSLTDKLQDRIYRDLAWAQSVYGNKTEGHNMTENKVITPEGRLLDRTNAKYINKNTKEYNRVIANILDGGNNAQRKREKAATIIDQINNNQKRVVRRDDKYYYILENGKEVPYDRVHTALGPNVNEKTIEKRADEFRKNLIKLDNIKDYDKYLNSLETEYEIDLSPYKGKNDYTNREAVIKAVLDNYKTANSKRALRAGQAVDDVVRAFFITEDPSSISKPDALEDAAFEQLLNKLQEIKENIDKRKIKFLTNNIVLFHKYADGRRIAGEVDILAIDEEGNFYIYDVKTSKSAFGTLKGGKLTSTSYFDSVGYWAKMSDREYYTMQVSAYANLFWNQYGEDVKGLGLLPFALEYDDTDNVINIQGTKGISITYNPNIAVPKEHTQSKTDVEEKVEEKKEERREIPRQDPVTSIDVTPTGKVAIDSKDAGIPQEVYQLNDKIVKGPMWEIGTIAGKNIRLTRVPEYTNYQGSQVIAGYTYYAVFPNGKTFNLYGGIESQDIPIDEVIEDYKNALAGNPDRVISLSEEKTLISSTIQSAKPSEPSLSDSANSKLNSVLGGKRKKGPKLREIATANSYTLWDKNKEVAWLNRVLPQLNQEGRIQFVKGLIKVAENGPEAWGSFGDGIMTLSDIAAEGTAYHEAFHVVFDLMLTEEEKKNILDEARKKWGEDLEVGELEELLAEDFREYVMTEDTRTLGRKILDFFKSLLTKILFWRKNEDTLYNLYRDINSGKYANYVLLTEGKHLDTKLRAIPGSDPAIVSAVRRDAEKFLSNFDLTINDIDDYTGEVPLFDALNRVINVRSDEDIIDGLGEAVAFMMQASPEFKMLMGFRRLTIMKPGRLAYAIRKGNLHIEDIPWSEKTLERETRYESVQGVVKELGITIQEALRQRYGYPSRVAETPALKKMMERAGAVISALEEKCTPVEINQLKRIATFSEDAASAVQNNNMEFIVNHYVKPGTSEEGVLVQIEEAFEENPYEENIVSTLSKYGIALAGSASMAVVGKVWRPAENPMHDLDFSATPLSEEDIINILTKEFPNFIEINTINGADGSGTKSYLILNRPFRTEINKEKTNEFMREKGLTKISAYKSVWDIIDAETGELLGTRYNGGDLELKEGVTGKTLDFFINEQDKYPNVVVNLNGKDYLFADWRGAMKAKIAWHRPKDIFDYNRFILNKGQQGVPKYWNSLNKETQDTLTERGYTPTSFNNLVQEEKDQIIKCLGV